MLIEIMLTQIFLSGVFFLTMVNGKTESDTNRLVQVIMREQASMIKHCMNNVCTRNMYNPNKPVGPPPAKKIVAFTASPENHQKDIKANSKLIFGKLWTNIGNAYDPSTGVFTAPSNGVYAFHWTIMTLHGKYTVVHIQVNGVNKVLVYGNAKNYPNWYSPSQSYVTYLKKKDTVNLALDGNGGGYVHSFSTFTGYSL